jgi:hypothetical protein
MDLYAAFQRISRLRDRYDRLQVMIVRRPRPCLIRESVRVFNAIKYLEASL